MLHALPVRRRTSISSRKMRVKCSVTLMIRREYSARYMQMLSREEKETLASSWLPGRRIAGHVAIHWPQPTVSCSGCVRHILMDVTLCQRKSQ